MISCIIQINYVSESDTAPCWRQVKGAELTVTHVRMLYLQFPLWDRLPIHSSEPPVPLHVIRSVLQKKQESSADRISPGQGTKHSRESLLYLVQNKKIKLNLKSVICFWVIVPGPWARRGNVKRKVFVFCSPSFIVETNPVITTLGHTFMKVWLWLRLLR